jgi:hypothetical protein
MKVMSRPIGAQRPFAFLYEGKKEKKNTKKNTTPMV